LFETAPRLPRLFEELLANGGSDKQMVIGRELTKKFEEIDAGTVEVLSHAWRDRAIKGELTIVLR